MSAVDQEQVLDVLRTVQDTARDGDVVSNNLIKAVDITGSTVTLDLGLPTPAYPRIEELEAAIRTAVEELPGVNRAGVRPFGQVKVVGGPFGKGSIPGVKNAIAVASGKGGVGKSTVAVNIAVALARDNARVGLLDADVYGPSVPLMMGVNAQPRMSNNKIIPLEAFGVKLMSIGLLLPADKALIWRGPLVAQLITQFLDEVDWGTLDYLIVDMPPGTGDVQLTLAQKIQISGAVIVTTPQDIAVADAIKGIQMFEEVEAPILGIVENMSYFVCPDCGSKHDIFDAGGGLRTAERHHVKLLGQIPLSVDIRVGGDIGHPIAISDPKSESGVAFREAARQTAFRLAEEAISRPHKPTIMLNPTG